MRHTFFLATALLTALAPAVASAATAQSNLAITVTSNPSPGSDPTTGLLPSNRDGYASWSTAGLVSVGGIPNRTTIYRTLSPSGTDDTAAINAALASCPSGQVVLLTAGVFRVTGNGLILTAPNCTLRGAGPGQQLNTGVNVVGGQASPARGCTGGSTAMTVAGDTFCVDPSATQLIKADRGLNAGYPVLSLGPLGNDYYAASTNLASDVVQGAYSLTLASAPNPAINVGDLVYIDMNTLNDSDVVYGPSFNGQYPYSTGWFTGGRQGRNLNQIMEVTGISGGGTIITFNTPFHSTFTVANNAQLTQYQSPFLRGTGVENLWLWGGLGGDGGGNVSVNFCAYCWVKNVESVWSNGGNVAFNSTFRSVLRDSFMHETPNPSPGGGGYQSSVNTGSSDNLFENNIMWYGNKEIVMRAAGGGNVVAYNYMDDAFGQSYPDSPEAGLNAGHYTASHLELLEGNYSQNFKGDSYWGPSIYITVFRNWLSALRAAHSPLNTYSYNGGSCNAVYADINGRVATDVQAYSFYQSFIGNVLGMNGQVLLSIPAETCQANTQHEFLEQVTTLAQAQAASAAQAVVMWQFGFYTASENPPGTPFSGGSNAVTFIDTINTQIRTANWDWVTQVQKCFDKSPWTTIGNLVDQGCSGVVTVPPSFYLTSKPPFFASTDPWPWVDPTTGATSTLPAKYCFQQGKMPTCRQGM